MREIYAELSKSMLPLVDDGVVELPSAPGVSISRRRGSRVCYFICDSNISNEHQEELIEEIGDQLDELGINWQEN